MNARNLWWRTQWALGVRRAKIARGETRAAIQCLHTSLGACFLRIRPGDSRKACWAQCRTCGKYVSCNC